MSGGATAAGTRAYRDALSGLPVEHFRTLDGLVVSSIGLGTYLGEEDDATDRSYEAAIVEAVALGSNLLDTAINYRAQRSERALGAALRRLAASGTASREQLVVCTKAGYLPFDGYPPIDPAAYFRDTYVRPGILAPADIVAGCHAMTPRFLADQLARSRRNLGVDHLDVVYLHNPETQLGAVAREEFRARLRAAFVQLEAEVAAGRVGRYGVATWHGLRRPPSARDHLALAELVAAAREAGGADHHLRVVQLPYNLAMPEAYTDATQVVDDKLVPVLEAAARFGLAVVASASILQGQLSLRLPRAVDAALPGLDTPAQRALQFVRSTPGVTASLVGMARPEHVRENLRVARLPPAPAGVDSLLGRR